MIRRWNISDLSKILKVDFYGFDMPVPEKLITDSREISSGDGFVALQGEHSDGHLYIKDAIERGAKFIIASNVEAVKECLYGVSYVILDDMLSSLYKAAQKLIKENKIKIIAVTGSVGKTTTKECIFDVLSKIYKVNRPHGSYNTKLGCALALLTVKPDTDIVILEMGANHINEISDISSCFMPDIAIITNIEPCHLEGFINIDNVANTKFGIVANNTKILFLNCDNEKIKIKSNEIKTAKFEIGMQSKICNIKNVESRSESNEFITKFKIENNRFYNFFRIKAWGIHIIYSISFAFAISGLYKICSIYSNFILNQFTSLAGRGKVHKYNDFILIDDSYNANPTSMMASLETLKILNLKPSLVVLGEMKELGDGSFEYHKKVIDNIKWCDYVFLIGDAWYKYDKYVSNNVFLFKNVVDCVFFIKNIIKYIKVILVKGSHSNNLDFIVNKIDAEYKI